MSSSSHSPDLSWRQEGRLRPRASTLAVSAIQPRPTYETGALGTAAWECGLQVLTLSETRLPRGPLTGLSEVQSNFFPCSEVPSPLLPSPHQPCLSQPRRLGRALDAVPLRPIQLAVRPSWGPIQCLCCSLEDCTIGYSMPVPQGVRPLWSSAGEESHIPGAGPGPTPTLPALQP